MTKAKWMFRLTRHDLAGRRLFLSARLKGRGDDDFAAHTRGAQSWRYESETSVKAFVVPKPKQFEMRGRAGRAFAEKTGVSSRSEEEVALKVHPERGAALPNF
jgi:hypothetical protein